MTTKILSTPLLLLLTLVLALAGCASPQPAPVRAHTPEAEVKMLEDQAQAIVADFARTNALAKAKILPGDALMIQVWSPDKTTQLPGFPFLQNVPDSGSLFIPSLGLTEVAGKTDREVQALLADQFSQAISNDTSRIRPGDELTIQVWKHDKITQLSGFPLQQDVPDAGSVFLPSLGLVEVTGKTDGEVRDLLAGHFSKILADATIVVGHKGRVSAAGWQAPPHIIVSHASGTSAGGLLQPGKAPLGRVVLMGWGGRSGIYPLEVGLTIRDLIAQTGGFWEYADTHNVYIVRGNVQDPEIITINVARIMAGKDLEKNILLQANDAVYIPPINMWRVYDVIRKVLLPVKAVRDAFWESTTPMY